MAALDITSTQKTQLLDPVDTTLQQAFLEGVKTGATQILNAIERFNELTPEQQELTRDTFRLVLAAFIKSANILGPLPSIMSNGPKFTGSFTFKNGSNVNQTIQVQDGVIVSVA